MRVVVIPCENDDGQKDEKPVGIVPPMGPSLDQKTKGKTKGSKMLKTKRLDSVLSGIHAKKGFKTDSPSAEELQDDGFDLGQNENFQMKTMDGTSSIKIIKKVDDNENAFANKKSSVSSSVQSESESERKVSIDSDKQLCSPPALEELEPIASSPSASETEVASSPSTSEAEVVSSAASSTSSSGHQSPKPESKVSASIVETVTVKPKPKPIQKVAKPRGRPPGSKNVDKRRIIEDQQHQQQHQQVQQHERPKINGQIPPKRAKQQQQQTANTTGRGPGRPAGPKSRKTKENPTVSKYVNRGSYKGPPPPNYDHHQQQQHHNPPPAQRVSYQQNGEHPFQRDPPKYRQGYRPSAPPPPPPQQQHQREQAPYVYQAPSVAPIRPAAPVTTAVSPIPPKVIPTFDTANDDAPLDLTMYSKKRINGTLKKPSPPSPKKAQRVQNQPLNLKRISSGKVIGTVSVNIPKMKTPSPVKRDPRQPMPTPPPPPPPTQPRQSPMTYRKRLSSKDDHDHGPKMSRSAPPPPSSPIKKTPPSANRPPQKLKSINMTGKHIVSVANVKCQKPRTNAAAATHPPKQSAPVPPPTAKSPAVDEKSNKLAKPKVTKKSSKVDKGAKASTPEDKSILVHRGKTIEQRLNMEFANKEKDDNENGHETKADNNSQSDDAVVVAQAEEDAMHIHNASPNATNATDPAQYAPRTVSGCLF